jgi:phage protein D
MAIESLSGSTFNFYAPRFEIEIENASLAADMSKSIIDVSVEERINEGASFTINVNDEFDREKQEFKWVDHPLFEVGNTVKIKFGYESTLLPLLTGNITSLEPSFFSGDPPTLSVRGQDLSYNSLKQSSPQRDFVNMSYSDIAGEIARDAGLSIEADSTETVEGPICKNADESYFFFLKRLAGEVGFEFRIDGDTIYFQESQDDKQEILVLELGKDLISFRPSMNTANLYAEVEVRGHNPADPSTPIVGRATAGSESTQEGGGETASQVARRVGDNTKVITNVIVDSVDHANAIAQAVLDQASDGFIEGEVECIGIPEIRAGVNVMIEKVGERFKGKYYVKAATHTINSSGYRTRFTVKKNTARTGS